MIKPICNFCGKKLIKFGGILFSPPDKNGKTDKYHICESCYIYITVPVINDIKKILVKKTS